MKEDLQVPSIKDFRKSVNDIGHARNSVLIKTLYLTASRCNEFMTRVCPSDKHKTKPLGNLVTYEFVQRIFPNIQYEGKKEYVASLDKKQYLGNSRPSDDAIWILLMKIPVSHQRKNKKKPDLPDLEGILWKEGTTEGGAKISLKEKPQRYKMIALPVPYAFDPWVSDLVRWLDEYKRLSFDLTRQTVLKIVKKELGYHTHFLRHIRITHLANSYGFTGEQISLVAGWTPTSGYGFLGQHRVSKQVNIYLHSVWENYIKKLLVPMDIIERNIKTIPLAP